MDHVLNFITNIVTFGGRRGQTETQCPQPAHPTLRFHTKCGTNVSFAQNNSVAVRNDHYENGIVFSNKPIHVDECVAVEILETANFEGPLYFGFTTTNPERMVPASLNSSKIRDLSERRKTIWMKGLFLQKLERNTLLSFWVDSSGSVQYIINGVKQEDFFQGINVKRSLWAVFDIYGFVSSIKLVDIPLNVSGLTNHFSLNNNNDNVDEGFSERRSGPVTVQRRNQPGQFQENIPIATAGLSNGRGLPGPLNLNMHSIPLPLTTSTNLMQSRSPSYFTPTTPSAFGFKECIICMGHEADTAFIKCGHLCMCAPCAKEYLRKNARPGIETTCPICRGPITGTLKTYS